MTSQATLIVGAQFWFSISARKAAVFWYEEGRPRCYLLARNSAVNGIRQRLAGVDTAIGIDLIAAGLIQEAETAKRVV